MTRSARNGPDHGQQRETPGRAGAEPTKRRRLRRASVMPHEVVDAEQHPDARQRQVHGLARPPARARCRAPARRSRPRKATVEAGQRPVDLGVPGGDPRLVLHRRRLMPCGQPPRQPVQRAADVVARRPRTRTAPSGARRPGRSRRPARARPRSRRAAGRSRPRVVGEVGDVGVDVERAVGGGEPVEAERGQAVEQQRAVAGVPGDVPVGLRVAVGRRRRRRAGRAPAGRS